MDHIAHVFGMEEIVGHILKFLPMKELHRVARYGNMYMYCSCSFQSNDRVQCLASLWENVCIVAQWCKYFCVLVSSDII